MLLVSRLPMRRLAGLPAIGSELAPGARLEGDAVLALGGEAVGALPGPRGGSLLLAILLGRHRVVFTTTRSPQSLPIWC